jgi:hypothetical protein
MRIPRKEKCGEFQTKSYGVGSVRCEKQRGDESDLVKDHGEEEKEKIVERKRHSPDGEEEESKFHQKKLVRKVDEIASSGSQGKEFEEEGEEKAENGKGTLGEVVDERNQKKRGTFSCDQQFATTRLVGRSPQTNFGKRRRGRGERCKGCSDCEEMTKFLFWKSDFLGPHVGEGNWAQNPPFLIVWWEFEGLVR